MPLCLTNNKIIKGNNEATLKNPSLIKGTVSNNCHIFFEATGTQQGTITITTKFANGKLFVKPLDGNALDIAAGNLSITVITPTEEIKAVITGAAADTQVRMVGNWYE